MSYKRTFPKSKIKRIIVVTALMLLLSGCEEEERKDSLEVSYADIPVDGISVSGISEDDTSDSSIVIEIGEKSDTDETTATDFDEEVEETEEAEKVEETEEAEETEETEEAEETEEVEETEEAEAIEEAEEVEEVDAAAAVTAAGPIGLNPNWKYADFSAIHTGEAVLYKAAGGNGIVIGVNAGHGTRGGTSAKTYCHPDMTPKVTGGSTASGSIKATAVSSGMSFYDGTPEASVTLREAQIFRDKLLAAGYDVLMVRDSDDVQLDNVARTVICNNVANCHIAIHWDGDNLSYDKGCFYSSTPDALKGMEPVATTWQMSEALGKSLIEGLRANGCKINGGGSSKIDLTQTSFSSVPSVDIELGNAASNHDDAALAQLADGLLAGVNAFFGR